MTQPIGPARVPPLRKLRNAALLVGVVTVGISIPVYAYSVWDLNRPRSSEVSDPTPAPTVDPADASAHLACGRYRSLAQEVNAGVLTPAELRAKLRDIYGSARLSSSPGIASSGEAMLREATSGTAESLLAAFQAFGAACSGVGV